MQAMTEILQHYAPFFTDAQGIDLALRCLAAGFIVAGLVVAFGLAVDFAAWLGEGKGLK